MKSFAIGAAVVLIVGGLATGARAASQEIKGTMVDVLCSAHASDAKFMADHDKNCLLMDNCVKSGYSVVTADHKVLKFDAKGNALAAPLIKNASRDKDWKIVVDGTVTGDTIAVTSLKLQ